MFVYMCEGVNVSYVSQMIETKELWYVKVKKKRCGKILILIAWGIERECGLKSNFCHKVYNTILYYTFWDKIGKRSC